MAAGIVVVGWIDWVTGTDIRVLAVYFIPMAFAGWRLQRCGAVLGAAGAAVVWLLAQHSGGVRYVHEAIWVINAVTQGVAFLTVGGLVAVLAERLEAEKALSRTDALTGLQNRRGLADHDALRSVGVTATIGVFTDGRSAMSLDALLAGADRSLYDGKQRGRDQVAAATAATAATAG